MWGCLRYNCAMNAQTQDITIQLNGSARQIAVGMTLDDLLGVLEMTGQRVAIEVNENVVPRSEYPNTVLQQGDRVEMIRAIGGG